jgi:NAD(P)-dependent dehydrogenase (short-subunit alcohol dehydrogenase family)
MRAYHCLHATLFRYIQNNLQLSLGMAREERQKLIPLGRFGTPDEVADAALFLAQNSYANNCILNLDGGTSAV